MKKTEQGFPIMNREELYSFLENYKKTDTSKGILLMGPTSVGKTKAMHSMYMHNLVVSANSLVQVYLHKGIEPFSTNGGKHIKIQSNCIDDIGTESEASYYGSKLDLIPFIIQSLYETRQKMSYTTNLNYNELKNRYGIRVIERLQEMCYFIVLDDEPFRKLTTAEDMFAEVESMIKLKPTNTEESIEDYLHALDI